MSTIHSKDATIRIGKTSSASRNGGTSNTSKIDEASSVSVDMDGGSVSVAQLGDDFIRRLDGKADFSVSVDVFVDLTITQHQDLVLAPINATEYLVQVKPDASSSNGLESVCLVESPEVELPGGGAQALSFTFSNSDGQAWQYKTNL